MSVQMRPGFHIEITTPSKVVLQGMWMGPKKAKRVVVWIHGLGSSLFNKLAIADQFIDGNTAVLAFNNRGHDKVAKVSRGEKRLLAGAAHEVFTECADDIEGAVRFAHEAGASEVFLAGHSTGCQKSIYWAATKAKGKKGERREKGEVKGIILLAPISDYAAELKISGAAKIAKGLKIARAMIRAGKKHELLPSDSMDWSLVCDAQRFVSLYSGESAEEIFPYWAPERMPATLRSVKLPILSLIAERDEYRDRPAIRMADWFADHLKIGDRVIVVLKVAHSFAGGEKTVAKHMKEFMKEAGQ
jgi:alpha-beta hydrolase superfamily lysophospholipase